MKLADILRAHPDRFYSQTWYEGEPFLNGRAERIELPDRVAPHAFGFMWPDDLPNAATLALLYVRFPDDPIWRRYLWTSDTDSHGQRVYVGENGHGLEIHRHLDLTERWGYPQWYEGE